MKVHYCVNGQFENGLACGRCDITSARTGDPEKVTCKTCLRVMARETAHTLSGGCQHTLPSRPGSTLKKYIRSDNGQKRYYCEVCNGTFKREAL